MRRIRLRWVILFFLLLSFCVYGSVLFGFQSFFATDITTQNHGYRAWAAETFKQGELPAWTPLIFTGFPVIAESQAGVFYPFFCLFFVLPVDWAYNIFIVLHYALASIFVFLFLRQYEISDHASFVVSIGFYFASILINYHVYPNHLSALVWLPAILASARFFQDRKENGLLVNSLLFCVQILAGHIQFVWLTILFGMLLALISEFDFREKLKTIAVFWIGAPLFGILLGALQVLPTMELYLYSQRATHDFVYATTPSFQLRFLAQVFLPSSFGMLHNLTYTVSGPQTLEEMMNLFIGVPVLFFAILGTLFDRTPKRLALIGIVLLGIFLALGSNQPLYFLIYKLPFFSFFRYPNRYIVLSIFAFLLLAGYGLDAALNQEIPKRKIKFAFLIFFCGILISWFVSGPQFDHAPSLTKVALLNKIRIQNAVYVLVSLYVTFLVAERWPYTVAFAALTIVMGVFLGYPLPPTMKRSQFISKPASALYLQQHQNGRFDSYYDTYVEDSIYNEDTDAQTKYMKMRELLCGDSNMLWGVPSTRGIYHPLIPANYYKKAGLGASWLLNDETIRLLGLHFYLADRPLPPSLSNMPLKPVRKFGDVQLYELDHDLPRVWVDDKNADAKTQIVTSTNRKTVIACDLKKPGTLILRDLYYPGWRVFVDGKESQIQKSSSLFRSVLLNQGNHEVVFEYPATIVKIGMLISLISFCALIFLYWKLRISN